MQLASQAAPGYGGQNGGGVKIGGPRLGGAKNYVPCTGSSDGPYRIGDRKGGQNWLLFEGGTGGFAKTFGFDGGALTRAAPPVGFADWPALFRKSCAFARLETGPFKPGFQQVAAHLRVGRPWRPRQGPSF